MVVFAPCCLLFGVCLVFFFPSFCDKRFAQIFWERFPGPLGYQACWQHIWPELFLSSQVKKWQDFHPNRQLCAAEASCLWPRAEPQFTPEPQGLANSCQLPRELSWLLWALLLRAFFWLLPVNCLCHVAFSLGSAGGKGVSPHAWLAWQGCTGIGSAALLPLQLFTDGITNKLVACYTDEGMADAVLVRVYGRKTELFVDRETELRSFQVLRAHGCAPDLYCAFQNGLCYQFLPGIALGPDHVRDPHIFRCAGPGRKCRMGKPAGSLLRVSSSSPRCLCSRLVLEHR